MKAVLRNKAAEALFRFSERLRDCAEFIADWIEDLSERVYTSDEDERALSIEPTKK